MITYVYQQLNLSLLRRGSEGLQLPSAVTQSEWCGPIRVQTRRFKLNRATSTPRLR
jgi:hypothetical protein